MHVMVPVPFHFLHSLTPQNIKLAYVRSTNKQINQPIEEATSYVTAPSNDLVGLLLPPTHAELQHTYIHLRSQARQHETAVFLLDNSATIHVDREEVVADAARRRGEGRGRSRGRTERRRRRGAGECRREEEGG